MVTKPKTRWTRAEHEESLEALRRELEHKPTLYDEQKDLNSKRGICRQEIGELRHLLNFYLDEEANLNSQLRTISQKIEDELAAARRS